MSAADKRKNMMAIVYDSKRPWTLKELESTGAKRGVVRQAIKDVLQELVDDDLIRLEKIGAANYYWGFLSQINKLSTARLEQLRETEAKASDDVEQLQAQVEEARAKRQREDRPETLNTLASLRTERAEIEAELEKLKDNDPEVLEELRGKVEECELGGRRGRSLPCARRGAQRRACAPVVVGFPVSALLCSALLCSARLGSARLGSARLHYFPSSFFGVRVRRRSILS